MLALPVSPTVYVHRHLNINGLVIYEDKPPTFDQLVNGSTGVIQNTTNDKLTKKQTPLIAAPVY